MGCRKTSLNKLTLKSSIYRRCLNVIIRDSKRFYNWKFVRHNGYIIVDRACLVIAIRFIGIVRVQLLLILTQESLHWELVWWNQSALWWHPSLDVCLLLVTVYLVDVSLVVWFLSLRCRSWTHPRCGCATIRRYITFWSAHITGSEPVFSHFVRGHVQVQVRIFLLLHFLFLSSN